MMNTEGAKITHDGNHLQQQPVQKQDCLEALPVVLFQSIQEYSTETDYRHLMNTNLSTFQSIKRDTVKYSLLDRPKKLPQFHLYQEAVFSLLINSVKDKSKQISMSFSDVNHSTVLKYVPLFKGIHKLSLSYSQAVPTLSLFPFSVFDNIHHLILENVHGIPVFPSAPAHIVKLELIDCGFTQFKELNPSKSLYSLTISSDYNMHILGSLDGVHQVDIFSDNLDLKFPRDCPIIKLNMSSVDGLVIPDLDPSFPYEKLEIFTTFPTSYSEELFKLAIYPEVDFTNDEVLFGPEVPEFPKFYGIGLTLEGFSLAQWNRASLPNLRVLHLIGCYEFSSLPEMPAVESIFLDNCKRFEYIPPLPSLKKLQVWCCSNFQSISFCAKLRTVEFSNWLNSPTSLLVFMQSQFI
jgi:hypothetical protein